MDLLNGGDTLDAGMMMSLAANPNFIIQVGVSPVLGSVTTDSFWPGLSAYPTVGATLSHWVVPGAPTKGTIEWNPYEGVVYPGGVMPPGVGLLHEAAHARDYVQDPTAFWARSDTFVPFFGNEEEERVMEGPEARALRAMGLPMRTVHGEGWVPGQYLPDVVGCFWEGTWCI